MIAGIISHIGDNARDSMHSLTGHIMFNNKINYRYYGLNVRVMPCGTGFDKTLIVQKLNPLTGDYINMCKYHESNSSAYTEAAQYAQALADSILSTTGN